MTMFQMMMKMNMTAMMMMILIIKKKEKTSTKINPMMILRKKAVIQINKQRK